MDLDEILCLELGERAKYSQVCTLTLTETSVFKTMRKNSQKNSLSLEIWHFCFLILLLIQTQRLLKWYHHTLFLVRFVAIDEIFSYCAGFELLGGHPHTFTATEPHSQRSDWGSDQTKQSMSPHLLCRGAASSSFFLIICRRTRHVSAFRASAEIREYSGTMADASKWTQQLMRLNCAQLQLNKHSSACLSVCSFY